MLPRKQAGETLARHTRASRSGEWVIQARFLLPYYFTQSPAELTVIALGEILTRYAHLELTESEVKLLRYLCLHKNADHTVVYPSQKTIFEEVGISKSTLKRFVAKMEGAGLIFMVPWLIRGRMRPAYDLARIWELVGSFLNRIGAATKRQTPVNNLPETSTLSACGEGSKNEYMKHTQPSVMYEKHYTAREGWDAKGRETADRLTWAFETIGMKKELARCAPHIFPHSRCLLYLGVCLLKRQDDTGENGIRHRGRWLWKMLKRGDLNLEGIDQGQAQLRAAKLLSRYQPPAEPQEGDGEPCAAPQGGSGAAAEGDRAWSFVCALTPGEHMELLAATRARFRGRSGPLPKAIRSPYHLHSEEVQRLVAAEMWRTYHDPMSAFREETSHARTA